MGKNKILLYTRDHDLQKILKKIALPYVSFRYNSTYELEVCNNMLGIYKSLNEPTTRVDYCCFYLEDEKELEIYKNIKKDFPHLPMLLFAYSKIDHNLFFRPGLFPELLVTIDIDSKTALKEIIDIEIAMNNIKEYLDSYQPDELKDHRKSIQSKLDRNNITLISGEEIISIETDKSSGKRLQKILTTRGEYFSSLSISEIEKIFATMLYRCRRDALINKSLIVGYNINNLEVQLSSGNYEYTVKASRDKLNEIQSACDVFLKNAMAC